MQLTGGVEIHFDAFLQCDQIGHFLKVFVNKFANKSSPQLLVTFGLFWNRSIYVKTAVDII